jgi:hypothetical protein
VWARVAGRRRRRAERAIAAQLVARALLWIRFYARQGPEHLSQIEQLADLVENLPGLGSGSGRDREPYGYHTFRWVWQTASNEKRAWLITQFEDIGYDYSYLDKPPSPPPRKPTHRSTAAKTVNAAALLNLDPDAALEIRHADPGAVHLLIPRGPDQVQFHPVEPGMSEFHCLLRMIDGETIEVHLRFATALFDAVPTRAQRMRWTTPDRDGYLWRRGHTADSCPICTSATNH